MPAALVIASLVMKGASMVKSNEAAQQSESLARSVARRNANLDNTAAAQLELDTQANTQAARRDAAIYTSRQATSYAASGVLANSGSPLAVQASTMGRIEQQIQQNKINANQKAQQMRSAAEAGIAYGDASARATSIANDAAMLKGGADLLTTAYGGYKSGAFSGVGSPSLIGGLKDVDFVGGTNGSKFNY